MNGLGVSWFRDSGAGDRLISFQEIRRVSGVEGFYFSGSTASDRLIRALSLRLFRHVVRVPRTILGSFRDSVQV